MPTTLKQTEPLIIPSSGSVFGVVWTHIDSVWDQCRRLVQKALLHGDGRYSAEDIYNCLKKREMQLWIYCVTIDNIISCAITEISNFPQVKICTVLYVAGENLSDWIHYRHSIEQWAKENDCYQIEAYGRMGWTKVVPDYIDVGRIYRKVLR